MRTSAEPPDADLVGTVNCLELARCHGAEQIVKISAELFWGAQAVTVGVAFEQKAPT